MTRKKTKPQNLQLRPMNRNKIYAGLAMAGVLAIVVAQCNRDESNDSIDVVFYQTAAQCEADINLQQAEYLALQQKYQRGEEDEAPTPPPMEAKDCAAQIQAAQQEHLKTAPVYASIAECQAEGVQCEATAAGELTAGYRPAYGGTYLDPYNSSHVYIHSGGSSYRVYETRTVYLSSTPGRIITPYGREISQTTTGRVSAPRHTSFSPPARPAGVSGSGTIRGRSTQGFGSTFKGSGFGGK
ncbi:MULTISPECIES: DUF1190 domain-containing protein [unclassified Chamaesiphon]|uniref:DUF1190 domain-containing protein n=1 Tax=unclassified Chamaesiphon TaxID=2620921 RepID=UPI00286A6F99|nr:MULTISPECIES: DUF1190 domain-containing protein [unclassified Chamaesiphon]